MPLTLELAPQTEAWLSAEAQNRGVRPADVARAVLEERVAATPHSAKATPIGKSPAELLLGLFASPADAALMDEVAQIADEGRSVGSTRNVGI